MATTTRRSPNATLVTQSAIDEASNALQDLPEKPKEKLSLREAVETLRDPIVAALEKGYSYDDITVMLANQGVNIAPSSLKHYLARSNRQLKAKGPEKQTRRKRAAKADSADITEAAQPEAQAAQPEAVEAAPKRGRQKAVKSANVSQAEPVVEAAPEETPKRGRRASGKSQAKPKTTTRSVSRAKSTASAPTRKRRNQTTS